MPKSTVVYDESPDPQRHWNAPNKLPNEIPNLIN